MKAITVEDGMENGIQEQERDEETVEKQQEWIKTIILNLVVATSVCLARAAMDYLVSAYQGERRYSGYRSDYPF